MSPDSNPSVRRGNKRPFKGKNASGCRDQEVRNSIRVEVSGQHSLRSDEAQVAKIRTYPSDLVQRSIEKVEVTAFDRCHDIFDAVSCQVYQVKGLHGARKRRNRGRKIAARQVNLGNLTVRKTQKQIRGWVRPRRSRRHSGRELPGAANGQAGLGIEQTQRRELATELRKSSRDLDVSVRIGIDCLQRHNGPLSSGGRRLPLQHSALALLEQLLEPRFRGGCGCQEFRRCRAVHFGKGHRIGLRENVRGPLLLEVRTIEAGEPWVRDGPPTDLKLGVVIKLGGNHPLDLG